LPTRPIYDVSIWEEIRSIVSLKIVQLVEDINNEISKDASLVEFQGQDPISWQLEEIVQQRGNAWVQRVYDLCSDAYKHHGKAPSAAFNRAVWAYCINPFILDEKDSQIHEMDQDEENSQIRDMDQDEKDSQIHDRTISGLLNLLLCAVGSPPERRALLTFSQKKFCVDVRKKIYDTWWDKLHLGPGIWEAVPDPRLQWLEARAARIVGRLSPKNPPPPPSTPVHPLVQPEELLPPRAFEADPKTNLPSTKAATWDAIEISFLSEERVQIRHGAATETLNYAEFGFQDGRNGKPNRAWEAFRVLAAERGIIRDAAKTGGKWPDVEKRIQEIRKVLREHFSNLS
jgi:hypothetical protein